MTQGKRDLERERREQQVSDADDAYRRGFYAAALLAAGVGKPNEKLVMQAYKNHRECKDRLRKQSELHISDCFGCVHQELAAYRGFRDGLDSAYTLWWMLTDLGKKEYELFICEWESDVLDWSRDSKNPYPPRVDTWNYIYKVASQNGIDDIAKLLVKPRFGMVSVGSVRYQRMVFVSDRPI